MRYKSYNRYYPEGRPQERLEKINSIPKGFVSLETFKWWRPPKGWVWLETERDNSSYEDEDEIEKKPFNYSLFPSFGVEEEIIYRPHLENNALFLEILDLKPTRESLASFVTKWGPLGWHDIRRKQIIDSQKAERLGVKYSLGGNLGISDPEDPYFEDLSNFLYPLKPLVQLWKAIKESNSTTLKEWIKLKKPDKVLLKNLHYGVPDVSVKFLEFTAQDFKEEFGKFFSGSVKSFNELNLNEIANLYLVNGLNEVTRQSRLDFQIGLNEQFEPHVFIAPETLRQFIILQFLLAVNENKDFKPCVVCKTYFEVEKDKRKNKKIYCSEKCKQVAFRNRHKKDRKK